MSAPFGGLDIIESSFVPEGQMLHMNGRLYVCAPRSHSRWHRIGWRLRHPFTRCPLKVIGGLEAIRAAVSTTQEDE